MIETKITILINRKSDFDIVKQKIIESNLQFPVYIFELDSLYQIELSSDYEEWELDSKILSCFPDYEFTQDIEKGRKEIRIQMTRFQSELSMDGWGRPIENPLNETKYLIKKSTSNSNKYNPIIQVLFGESEENYFVNIVNGINKSTNEKGFLLVNDFKTRNENRNAEILKDKLFKTFNEAFRFGYYKMQNIVNEDFRKHIQEEKRKITELNKIPRKIVRNFIAACNRFEMDEILKSLDNNIVFEKQVRWQTEIRTEGILHFEQYLKTSSQDLCSMNFKIRSSWTIKLPIIEIGVKFYPQKNDNLKNEDKFLMYRRFRFKINKDKIVNIIDEQ